MKLWFCALCIALIYPELRGAGNPPSKRSISTSQQFIIYCDDRARRQELSSYCDEIRRQTLQELGLSTGARTTIMVSARSSSTNQAPSKAPPVRWLDTPDGARVQIDLFIDAESKNTRFQEQIISALLLTLKYREQSPPDFGTTFAQPPAWLIEGLSEKFKLRQQQLDSAVYGGLVKTRQVPHLPDFLAENPAVMDPAELGVYQAYACAFLALLQDQPRGKARLVEYLQKIPADRAAALKLMVQIFPVTGESKGSLLKWWTLSLARLSATDRYVLLSAQETERQLARLLTLTFPSDTGKEEQTFLIEQYPEFWKRKETRAALAEVSNDLLRLSIRGNPLYRPVIGGYQEVLSLLSRGKTKGLERKVVDLGSLRQQILQRMEDVSDYLNWVEATQLPTQSGEFDGYLNLVNSYDKPRSPSNEPIGKYLDALETELK